MECLKCISICPSNCLDIDKQVSCVRLEEKSALKMDKEKCNECNMCKEVCPLGNITLELRDCSCCIVCKGIPSCMNSSCDEGVSFLNSINSATRLMLSKIRFAIQ